MKQEIIAGIILGVMGLSMLLLPAKTLWKITEKITGWAGCGKPAN